MNFFWGGSNGKVVAPGIVVICSIDKNRDHYTKNWLLAPNIQILGSKKHIFAPSGQLEPHRSMFSTRKRCLIGILIRGYQNFYSLPPKNLDFWPKNGQIWSKICIFGHLRPNIAIFCTFCPMPDQKIMRTRCLGGFSVMSIDGEQAFALSSCPGLLNHQSSSCREPSRTSCIQFEPYCQ